MKARLHVYSSECFNNEYYTVIDWVRGQQQFCLTQERSVAQSCRLRATDPFEGQTKLLLFEKPVYNCFVIHLHFFKIFLFTLFTHISIRCFQYPRPSRPRIWMTPWICYVNITWLIEPMKIRPWVNSSIAGNRSINCWPVNRTVFATNRDFVVNSKYCVFIVLLLYWRKNYGV